MFNFIVHVYKNAWSPYYVKDKVLLEKVQRRFTRMVLGIKEFDYPSRLKTLKLWSLEWYRYGIVEFNVPLDTLLVIGRTQE